MSDLDLERLVLRHVSRPNYRPVKPRVIAKKLGIPKSLYQDLKRSIKRLAKRGELRYGNNHLVQVSSSSGQGDVLGIFRRNDAGYGFVRPQGTRKAAGREDDIFIPARNTRDAASGDLVRVRTRTRHSPHGGSRTRGEITQIVERGTKQFVGTYFERSRSGLVQIDGTEFPAPIVVGDPGAKNAQPDDKVVVEMVRYPTAATPGEGVITEVLGPHGQPGVDTLLIMRQFGLPEQFPEEVLQDAREAAERFDSRIEDGRQDLTNLTVITIDPADARDFDDAISLEELENGHLRLGVHIADVVHFVKPGSALDREAKDRATSIYLPDRVIPMLPEVISNHLASLQPDQVRYSKSAFIEYTSEGVRIGTEFCSGAIVSKRRFSYEEVDDFLADRPKWRHKLNPDVYHLLARMHQLAMTLRRRRLERGSIELTLPELKIKLDRDGQVNGVKRLVHTESHQIIEEFMLAANEAVAERLKDDELHCLRRIHEAPDPRKLETLTEFVRDLGLSCDHLQSRFEIQRVLSQVAGEPLQQAVNYAVLRAMQKAVYGPQDEGHYALSIDDYCHFTSPIRRYPDLTIHRLIDSILKGGSTSADFDRWVVLGEHCSDREQRAESAERELIKLKLLNYLAKRIGESMDVVITGVEEFGIFAQGVEIPAEGLIHVDALPADDYHHDPAVHAISGHREENTFRLGDLLEVRIAHVDLDRRELTFEVLARKRPEQLDAAASTSQRPPARKKSSRRSAKMPTTRKTQRKTKPGGKSKRRRH